MKAKTLEDFKTKLRPWEGFNELRSKILNSGLSIEKREPLLREAAEAYSAQMKEEASFASNEQVLEVVFALTSGDDYDGCITEGGSIKLNAYSDEFYSRLKKCGYLPEDWKSE